MCIYGLLYHSKWNGLNQAMYILDTNLPHTFPTLNRHLTIQQHLVNQLYFSSTNKYGYFPTSLTATLSSIPIPTCYSQNVKDVCWVKAMQEELQALQDNYTWDIVPYAPSVKPIGYRWVYSVKLNYDDLFNHYKACLVALGNKQECGVD